ncbi:putative CmcJ-like methyltransferase [Achaetomium macrosporum]|uniref:CmcJ-like methyltransferase n=1 Tax=Achaetomium macrosporum TaxID=79813 RepID=A0AAN7H9L2_9PEZI|nr:putative CmcJ-like methyltransferase [Achaetomium macrosporum]
MHFELADADGVRKPTYRTEKPYATEFEIEEKDGVRRTNYVLASEEVTIREIPPGDDFTLGQNGFCVIQHATSLDVDQVISDPELVEDAYLQQLANILTQRSPEYTRVEPFEFVVRKRDERFRSNRTARVTHEQPAYTTHSDYSPRGALLQLHHSFPGQRAYFENCDFDMINVWRVLTGPNDDWPLTLCDFNSIDHGNDRIATDRMHKDHIGENELLFPNTKHKWYYIPGQLPDQLLVFRNTDASGLRSKAFHASFFSPQSRGPPRQSCEARFVAFRERPLRAVRPVGLAKHNGNRDTGRRTLAWP